MTNRNSGLLGLAACVIFWSAMLVLGSLRPSYSQLINDISELGAIGTPNATLWNVIGFIVPGVCLAIVGRAIAISANPSGARSGRIASWLLPLFGVGVAGQGLFPALMANGAPVVTSWHTRAHLLASIASGIAWLIAVLLLVNPMRKNPEWRRWYLINIGAALLVVAVSFLRGGDLPDGLVQRLGDAVVFGWFAAMSIKLIRRG